MAPASQIELLGLDHVDLRVKNREKTRRFFIDQLGLDVVGEGPHHSYLLIGDQVLGLHDAEPDAPVTGVDHIALRVSDWTGLRNRVRRARIVVLREKERDDSRSLFLRGPDGLSVELIWRPDPGEHHCRSAATPPPPPPDEETEAIPSPRPSPARRRPHRA